MNYITKWEDCEREDLNMIPAMNKAGWEHVFNNTDIRFGRTTIEFIPNNGVTFKKGTLQIWKCRDGWQVADLIDGSYVNHRGETFHKPGIKGNRFERGYIPNLKTILELESKNDL